MDRSPSFTRTELVIAAVFVCSVLLAGSLLVTALLGRPRLESRRVRCRECLRRISEGMAAYLKGHGDGRWHPCPLGRGTSVDDYNGGEWLASLYWTGIVSDPAVFLCPSSGDANRDGWEFGADRAIPRRFGSQTVSYAGMHYRSLTAADGSRRPDPLLARLPAREPMASDDTQGMLNHPGSGMTGPGMAVLFFDSHVEYRSWDIEAHRAVGKKGGLLWRLRN